jgi:expansin (peptidoglycan-binding protein)
VRHAYSVLLVMLAGCGSCSCGGCGGRTDAPIACGDVEEHAGEATYYDADGSGNCSFVASPSDLMVAAMNNADWEGSAVCGQCVEVDGPNGSVTVRITDRCPGCSEGDLDLSREAFQQIAALQAGRVAITWRPVPCDVSGPIRYRFKDGSNPFWVGIQVVNHRHAVRTLEAKLADGTWKSIGRESYNYFVDAAGLGEGPYTLRVTDIHGLTVEDANVPLGDATEVAGAAQLPVCQ